MVILSWVLQWGTWCFLNCNHIYNHLLLPAQTKNWLSNSLVLKGTYGAMVSPAVVTLSTRFGARLWIYRKMHVCEKTNWNYIFLDYESHIPSRLDIVVLYISFYRFWEISILTKNPNVLALGFTVKRLFAVKTNQNFVFLDREAHFLD
jgi:hypothetical protein